MTAPRKNNPEANLRAQEAYRKRKRDAGLEEVRALFAPPHLHPLIKSYAAALMRESYASALMADETKPTQGETQ